MNSNATPRPSSLPSTMTPRLHENPLAALRCAALRCAGSLASDDHAWFCSSPAPSVVGCCTPSCT